MKIFVWIGIIALLSCGCSQSFQPQARTAASEGASEAPTPPKPPAGSSDSELGICSPLDFSGIVWPERVGLVERRALALALNITGSFEGSGGWENLANNFDGQGISLGLNQQNLGQGTLQPILKSMIETNTPLTKMLFTDVNFKSMAAMIDTWSKNAIVESRSEKPLFPSDSEALSKLDIGFEPEVSILATRNATSVAWAVKTVFQNDKSTFKPDWKKSLRSYAATAPYRSLQVKEAMTMFQRAIGYFVSLGFKEQRSLLVMHDFVVQNGGFNSDHLAQLRKFDAANPTANESTRLLKLLSIRLVSVRPQYRSDVDARKRTIILGTGRVHGSTRDLPREYCYKSNEQIRGEF